MITRLRYACARHPAVVVGFVAVLVSVQVWLSSGSVAAGVGMGCFGVGAAVLITIASRRMRDRSFPSGLDREQRLAIRWIVLTGDRVEDPALAPGVVHHARVVRTRSVPALWWASLGCTVAAAGLAMSVISTGLTRANASVLIMVAVLGMMVFGLGPRPGRLNELAARAERHALSLLHA